MMSDQRYVRRRVPTTDELRLANALVRLTWPEGALDFDFVCKILRATHITEKQSRRLTALAIKWQVIEADARGLAPATGDA